MRLYRNVLNITTLVFLLGVGQTAFAETCSNGTQQAPPEMIALNSELSGKCMTPKDIEQLKSAADALTYLKQNVCPSMKEGYDASIPPAQLKETHVYFTYPSSSGKAVTMSETSLVCFANALKAMQAAGLHACVIAALRSADAQNASCRDYKNNPPDTPVCGRSSGCSGSYMGCPHVSGIAMDFNDSRTCKGLGSGVCATDSDFNKNWTTEMRNAAATAGAKPLKSGSDRPHLECKGAGAANVPNGGIVSGPQSTPYTAPSSPVQGLMQGLQNFFGSQQQCPAGYIQMYGQCMPQQTQAATQTTSPYSYASPASTGGSTVTSGTTGSTNSNTNTNTNTNSSTGSTGSTDIGGGLNISGLIDSSEKPATSSTSTSALDLISAIANPDAPHTGAVATGTDIGKPVNLNDSLRNNVSLASTPNTSVLSPTSTYSLNPTVSQTFVSPDLSPTAPTTYAYNTFSTASLLETMKQMLLSIMQYLRPFGGALPHIGTNAVVEGVE